MCFFTNYSIACLENIWNNHQVLKVFVRQTNKIKNISMSLYSIEFWVTGSKPAKCGKIL